MKKLFFIAIVLIAVFASAYAVEHITVTAMNVQPENAGGGQVFAYCGVECQVSSPENDMSLTFDDFEFDEGELLGYIYITVMQDGRVGTGIINWNSNMNSYVIDVSLPGIVPVKPIDPIKKG